MNGVKDCKKDNHSVVRQYSVKNSRKCIKTILKVSPINMFYQNLQIAKKSLPFREYLASDLW